MKVDSSLHTQKNIVTLGEFVDMVKDRNWKRDVSYILTEEYDNTSSKWKESPSVEAVADVTNIKYDSKSGTLEIMTDEMYLVFSNVTESTLMRDVVASDNPNIRCTVYMT